MSAGVTRTASVPGLGTVAVPVEGAVVTRTTMHTPTNEMQLDQRADPLDFVLFLI